MTTLSCPKCNDQVTVPAGAVPEAEVRCPLCQAQFELSEALAQLPPMLEIVNMPVATQSALAGDSAVGAAPMFAPTDDTGELPSLDFEPEDAAAPGEAATDEAAEAGGGMPVFEQPADADAMPAFGFGEPSGDADAADAAAATQLKTRPRKKPRSIIWHIAPVVVGGLLALPITQMILWWLPGQLKRDPFKLAPKLPSYVAFLAPESMRNPTKPTPEYRLKTPEDDGQPYDSGLRLGSDDPETPEEGTPEDVAPEDTTTPDSPDDPDTPDTPDDGGEDTPTDLLDPDALDLPDIGPDPGLSTDPDPFDAIEPMEPETDPSTDPSTDPPADPEGGLDDPFDLPPVETDPTPPEEPATPAVGLRDAAEVAEAELAAAEQAAQQAVDSWDAAQQGDKAAKQQAVGAMNDALSSLGRALAYVKHEDPASPVPRDAVAAALTQMTTNPINVPLLGRLAEGRIAQGGASGGGIALAGTVKQVEFAGGLYKTQLELAGKQKLSVTVLSLENPLDNPRSAYQVDDRVFILGALITDTTAAIEGYQGEEAVVVWSGYALAIPAGD